MKYILSSFKIGCGLYILFDLILTAANRYIDGIADFIKERSKEK